MGCSPSKGQLFSKKALPSAPQELLSNTTSEETETQDNTLTIQGKRSSVDDVFCDAPVRVEEDGTKEDVEVAQKGLFQDGYIAQEGLLENMRKGIEEIKRKDKQGKRRKLRKQKIRETSYVQSKAEFILKAQQAACAFLNPSISRYESLLELLEQAAQTRLSVQSTAASIIVHYEEINQALEEMAAEGEQMLWEHGHYMTWPGSLVDCPNISTKLNKELNISELPSEMLQQMLLHSTLKMTSVGDSVKCVGDSALQELADYFGSLSQLLGEKLLAKHAAERRLKQVLTHVEAAALRKASPEDSALHSEDSGIGADNECQNGSERLRRHRESSGSGAYVGITSVSTTSSSPDQQLLNCDDEVTDNDDDDDDNDNNDDAEIEEVNGRDEQMTGNMKGTICGSSETESSYPLIQKGLEINDQGNSKLKRKTRRPKTADNSCQVKLKQRHLGGPKRSQSTECLRSHVEDSDLRNKQTPEQFLASKNLPRELRVHVRTKSRKHSSGGQNAVRYYGLQYGSKGPFRTISSNSPPTFTPEPPGRNAVKRLINTFSQGVDSNFRQDPLDQTQVRVKSNRKCCLPLLLKSKGALTSNGNVNSGINSPQARTTERPEHLDLDSLPPPPPEMLIDNLFEKSVRLSSEEGSQLQRDTVATNRANVQQVSMSYSATRPVRQDALVGSCIEQDYNKADEQDSERETAATFNQHFQKAIHLPDLPVESTTKTGLANGRTRRSPPHQGCDDHNEGDAATLQPKFFPPTTPPVSRARLPPSCPTVHHAVPSPPSTVFPSSEKTAPSTTPTTPGINRWAMAEENDPPVSSSQSFSEARSVFCQSNHSVPHTWTPSCTSTLPRPWGEPARRRLPTAHLQPCFMRCSPSGQRSSHSEQQQLFTNARQQQSHGSVVAALTTEGTNIMSILSDDNKSDQEPYTAHLNTHSAFEREEITD